jgi:aminoglycoside phosphotransferase (APT) family kinase protein
MMDRREAQLLRATGAELMTRVSAELGAGPTQERLRFLGLMLGRMAGEIDLAADVSGSLAGDYADARRGAEAVVGGGTADLPDREALSALVQRIAGGEGVTDGDEAVARIVGVEVARRQALDAKLVAAGQKPAVAAQKNNVFDMVTSATMTAYLRATFADPGIEATEVKVLPGGRSKYTIFISLQNATSLPAQFVMRQDTGSGHIPTDVVDEYPLLLTLSKAGMPVPRPLHIERGTTALGGPFIFVERVDGVVPGDYFTGMKHLDARMAIDIARALGRMHSLDVGGLDVKRVSDSDLARDHFIPLVEYYRERWRRDGMEPSPLVEAGYAWLLRQAQRSDGRAVLVHGDVGCHNMLHKDGRLAAMLDWELFHIGDAGEDLGYCRQFIEPIMNWNDFLAAYRAAGGEDVDDRRILMGSLWAHVRNSTFTAASAHEYYTGEADDIGQGAFGYFVLPRLETMMAPLIQRAWQMEVDDARDIAA